MSEPIVLVLAGGASNRFWPLGDKQLLRFGSQSLLQRHLQMLSGLGCRRIVVVTRPESLEAVRLLAADAGAGIEVAVQAEALGMAAAVSSAVPVLAAGGDQPVYITQAHDVVEKECHERLLDAWSRGSKSAAGLIAAARVTSYFPGGYLTLKGERVTSIVEKPAPGQEPGDLVNLVAHLHPSWQQLVEAIEAETPLPGGDDVYERALSRLMQASEFRAVIYEGRWQALKYPWHVLDVLDMLLDLWQRGVESPGAEYEPRGEGVFAAPDARVLEGAHIVAPALLGPGSMVGQGALVRSSLLGQGCVAGFGCEVARSLLVERVELHHDYVGDSVLDAGSSMGFGAVTANYRLDGRSVPSVVAGTRTDTGRMKLGLMLGAGAKIGVQTATMPGVKIGRGAIIGPGLKVTRDVPDGERVLDEETYGRF